MTLNQQTRLESMIESMEQQVKRYSAAWEEKHAIILEEEEGKDDTDESEYDKLEDQLSAVKKEMRKARDQAFAFIEKFKSSSNATPGSVGPPRSSKIDDTLKPKETLQRSMSLEEFNVWSDRFFAYFRQNDSILSGQSSKVKRELLNNCIEPSLVQALATDSTITIDTPIIGDNSCLTKLKEIFLQLNPLFLRRYDFQTCVQKPSQTFPEWWAIKLTKAKECDLDTISKDEILLLELIRGVHDPKLKEEFLKQQNPTLANLKSLAQHTIKTDRI